MAGHDRRDPGVYVPAVDLPDYTTWNVGIGFTWKVFTLDLRYSDTDLSKTNCFVITGDPHAGPPAALGSNWCGSTFVAKLSVDTTLGRPEVRATIPRSATGGGRQRPPLLLLGGAGAGYSAGVRLPSRSAKWSPSRTKASRRRWNAASVERWPIETMVAFGSRCSSRR